MNRPVLACVLAGLCLIADGRSARAETDKGPVFQVEALIRHEESGDLYYFRVLLHPGSRASLMQGFGVGRDGECLPPPRAVSEDFDRAEPLRVKRLGDGKESFPRAQFTHHVGASIETSRAGREELHINVSCLGTAIPLPEKPGRAEFVFHQGAFRVEQLTAAQAERVGPLRPDPNVLRGRFAALRDEALAAHRARPLRPEAELPEAAAVFREPTFVRAVRAGLAEWVNGTPEEVEGKGFPNHLAYALARCGEADDFALFHRLARRHPGYASYVQRPTLLLIGQAGGARAAPLVDALLADPSPSHAQPAEELLRRLDPALPRPTQGDELVRSMTVMFRLDPAAFGLRMAEARLLELADQHPFTKAELDRMRLQVENKSGTWTVLTEADRKRAYEAARKWVAERK